MHCSSLVVVILMTVVFGRNDAIASRQAKMTEVCLPKWSWLMMIVVAVAIGPGAKLCC